MAYNLGEMEEWWAENTVVNFNFDGQQPSPPVDMNELEQANTYFETVEEYEYVPWNQNDRVVPDAVQAGVDASSYYQKSEPNPDFQYPHGAGDEDSFYYDEFESDDFAEEELPEDVYNYNYDFQQELDPNLSVPDFPQF